MIVKEKQFSTSADPRIRAGDEAEKDIAFRLARRFGNEPDIHIINDLRIDNIGTPFQIDHLLVTRWALFIVESKSVHGTVSIKVWDDKREHWSRSYNEKTEGIDSPVLQAEEQARLLKQFLRDNCEQVRDKMLGVIQKGFRYCPVITMAAISRTGIIEVESGTLPPQVFKADEIAPEISKQLAELSKITRPYSLSLDVGWDMTAEEAKKVADFLAAAHAPLVEKIEISAPTNKTQGSANTVTAKSSNVPRVGALCPKCGTRKLIRKSVKRTDGTETDFLACEGHPKDCQQIFALVTQTLDTPVTEDKAVDTSALVTTKLQRRQMGKKYCYKCKIDIQQNVADYCFGKPELFGGRAYCRKCQNEFRP